jgi:hypothetical protein
MKLIHNYECANIHITMMQKLCIQNDEITLYSTLRNSGHLKEHVLVSPTHRCIDNLELESCIININEI